MAETKTPPFGYCIYCGAAGRRVKLTDEHVIPYALDGDAVLTKASCLACAKITGRIEQRILRGIIYEARTHLNMRTRRPKERPRAFPVKDLKTGEVVQLPLSRNPFVLRLPLLAPAQILEWIHEV